MSRRFEVTAPGRLAAAPRGGSEPDRETRIGFGSLTLPRTYVAFGDRSLSVSRPGHHGSCSANGH